MSWPDLKRSSRISVSWPNLKRSSCISVDPYRPSKYIYGIFIALACLYQNLLPKNCWWPFMTCNDIGDMSRGQWSQCSDSGCQVYLLPMLESISNGFGPKEAPFNFLPMIYNGGRKIDLTLGHWYQNSGTNILKTLLRITIAERFKVIGHSV